MKLIQKLIMSQTNINRMLEEIVSAIQKDSEDGERISSNESRLIKQALESVKKDVASIEHAIYKERAIEVYNGNLVVDIPDCHMCKLVQPDVQIMDIVGNPLFPIIVFSIKTQLEVIDDRIAENDHRGIKACLTSIAHMLYTFRQLKEVGDALSEVADTFDDITQISDMMFDFEKFYKSVFILHEPLNVGIALGSIKSVLPHNGCDCVEFF